jgi:hypothetical protein
MGLQDEKTADEYAVVLVAIPKEGAIPAEDWLSSLPAGVVPSQGAVTDQALENLLNLRALLKEDDGVVDGRIFSEALTATGSSAGMAGNFERISAYLAKQRGEDVDEGIRVSYPTPMTELLHLAEKSPTKPLLEKLNVRRAGFMRFQLACSFLLQAREFPE